MTQHRFRYRKITPEKLVEMKELKKLGKNYRQIAKIFGVSDSVVQYHLVPRTRAKCKKRAQGYNKKLTHRQVRLKNRIRKVYLREYLNDRYKNDLEFNKRLKKSIKISSKKIRDKRIKNHICAHCGKTKVKKGKTCKKCKLKIKAERKRVIKTRKELGLCVKCGKPKEKNFKRCFNCRLKDILRKNSWTDNHKCYSCGHKNPDYKIRKECPICVEKSKIYQKRYINKKHGN